MTTNVIYFVCFKIASIDLRLFGHLCFQDYAIPTQIFKEAVFDNTVVTLMYIGH